VVQGASWQSVMRRDLTIEILEERARKRRKIRAGRSVGWIVGVAMCAFAGFDGGVFTAAVTDNRWVIGPVSGGGLPRCARRMVMARDDT
jgi:hypothetical protein